MNDGNNSTYEFDFFRLIPAERQLLREGQPVALPPKVFDTLAGVEESPQRPTL